MYVKLVLSEAVCSSQVVTQSPPAAVGAVGATLEYTPNYEGIYITYIIMCEVKSFVCVRIIFLLRSGSNSGCYCF